MRAFRNKTFRAIVGTVTLIATTFVYSGPPRPDAKAVDILPEHPMYLGTLTGGLKTNDSYAEGNFSIVAPVWSTLGVDNTLSGGSLFLEPYISWGEGGEVASSLGLGYRYLFGNQSMRALTAHDGHQAGFFEEGVAIGANVFIDMLDTEANNQLWQLGVGAELQTRYVELRGNYYIPLSNKQLAEQTRTRRTFTSSSSSVNTFQSGSGAGNPFATGNTISQDVNLSTYATTTTRTTTTTIEQLFRRYEEGMEGWDAEMAILVPGVDRYFDLRLIGGYYSFDNQPFGPQTGGTGNVQGWKAGLEVRPVPAVILNGTWYEDDRLTGSDWTVGLQLQMPFEAGDLGDGKDFWDRIGDSFKPRRRHLIERLAEPVRRQNAAVKVANSFDEDTRILSQKTNVKRVTKVLQQTNQRLVLVDDIIFVNNGGPTGNGIQTGTVAGTGTAELPVNTVQAGATLAGTNSTSSGRVWNVYTQGGAPYAENVLVTAGSVNFIGSGKLITGQGGKTFGEGGTPNLTGGFSAANVNTLGVTGYNISNGFGGAEGIVANNVTNLKIDQVTIQNAGTHGISLNNLGGTAVLTDVSVNNSTNNGVQVTGGNVLTALLAQNLDIAGSGNSGLNFIGAAGTYNFDGTSSIENATGAAVHVNGGSVDVNYLGDITKANNTALVAVVNGHTGDLLFQGGALTATSGEGLLFNNADGTYNFLGTTTLTNGAKIAVLNGSAGDFGFGAGTSVTNGNGQSLLVDNSTADIIYAGSVSQGSGRLLEVISHSTGTIEFTSTSNLAATGGDGLFFNNADGTYRFLGTTNLNGGAASIDLVNGSDGTFAFGTNTSITNPSGNAFFVNGGNSTIAYAGTITDNAGFAVQILNHGTGTVAFTGTVTSTAGGNGVQLLNNAGTFQFANVTAANTAGNAIEIVSSATATHTFGNISLTSATGRGVNLINAGTVNLLDGSINGTGGEAIFSQNTALTATSLTIGDNTSLATPTFGIVVQNTDGTARVVNLSNNSIRAQIHGISTIDSGVAGGLTLILDGNTYQSTLAGGKSLNIVGSGTDSTTIRSMVGGTVVGNGIGGGGLNFERVTFDADGATAGNQAVAAGNWNIGQGVSNRVFGDGLRLINPTGELTFGTLNIFNTNGTGLYVDTKGLGTTFALNNIGGVIDTTNGAAQFLDPLTVNLTFSSVSSTNSGGSGIYLDEVAGTLNLGNVTITNSANAAYVQEDSTVAVTAGTVNITNPGGDGMVFNSAGGSFTAGVTTINGFNGIGINFTGSGVNATFGVTTISNVLNGGTGTAIDLSSTTGNAISFAGGSSISNVAVGVELSASGTTATSANALFTFGDGEGVIDKESSINAAITVNASGLAATGLYNFQDVNFTGVAGFPAAAGSALFVSATALNGVGDGSLLNPYSVADANAITAAATFAFLDGSYDFATLNGGAAFSLSSGQSVVGLDNTFGVVYGTTQPVNVLGDFGMLGGTATRANTGNGSLTIVNSAAANVFELGGSNTISNITVNGSANTSALFSGNGSSGVIVNGVAVSGLAAGNTALSFTNMTGNVTVQGNNINTSAGTLLSISGGSATYIVSKGALPNPGATPGTLSGANVSISNITGGTVTLTGASITGLTISNTAAGSAVNVNDSAIAGAAGTKVNISSSAGAVTFNAATTITGGSGVAFNVSGGTGDITHNGSLTQNNAAGAINIVNRTAGTVTFGGAITASTGTATSINLGSNTGSTINFNGGFSLNTTSAAAFTASGGGTFNVAAAPSVTINTTEGGLGLSLANITLGDVTIDTINVVDGLSSGTNGAVSINGTSGGTFTVGNTSVERVLVDAISISNVTSGTYTFTGTTGVTSTFAGANAIDISNAAAGATIGFSNINLTTVNGAAAVLLNNNAGAISFTGGQINRVTGGDGINSTNTNLTVSNVSIGNNTTFAVAGRGINIANTGANVRTVTLTDNNIRSGTEAIRTTDSATGTLLLNVSGNTLHTTGAGVKSLHIAGAALNSTIVTSFNGGTVIGNNSSGGVLIDRATFDASGQTLSGTQVAGGTWNIGQSTSNYVAGDGLNFTNPSGSLNFTTLNVFNSNGTGLLVNAKTTTFTLAGGGSGTISTQNGTALNLDPLTTNLTFGTVTSTNSGAGNPGVIFDAVAGSVTIGTLNVTNAGTHGLVVQNSSGTFNFTNINVTGTGGEGIRLAGNTSASIFNTNAGGATVISGTTGDGIDLTGQIANPTVNMLGTVGITNFGGIGVNFTGANVTASFGVITINNLPAGSTGTAIDLSSTTGTRNITFAAGSAISNVAVGVQIGATSGTAANANFIFGDGLSANGLQSSISATTTVAALGLDPAPNTPGVYNFNDVTFTGTVLFPAAPGGAVFVSASAVNGAGDGSLANPYSVADANNLTGTLTFGFLDGTYNFASLGTNGFTLEANQSAVGLDNGNGIAYGLLQPNRVLGNFGVLGGTATRANTGNGTLSITNGTIGGSVFSLLGSNSIGNLTLTGEAGANDPSYIFSTNGAALGFNNAGGISVTGVTITSGTAVDFLFSAATGAFVATNNNINTAGALTFVSGGTGTYSFTKGTGTLTAGGFTVINSTGGSLGITGAALNATSGTAMNILNGNAATVTLTDVAITRSAGITAFLVDSSSASTGAITINGASSLDNAAASAFLIGSGARDINASALNFNTAGATTTVIQVTGQSGGTISFGNVGVTGFNNAASTAVTLAGTGGTVTFGDLDIATTAGAGLNVGAVSFRANGTPTISATGAAAVTLNGTTINGGSMNFTSVTSTGGTNGISMTNVTGTTGFDLITISGSTGSGVFLSNAGTVHLRDGSINGVGSHGVEILNTGGSIGRVGSLDIGTTGAVAGNGIHVLVNDAVSRTMDIFTVNVGSNVSGKGIFYTQSGSAAQQLFIESSATNSAGNGVEVVKSGSGNLEFRLITSSIKTVNGAALVVNGSAGAGTLFVTQQSGNDFTVGAGGGVLYNTVTFDSNLGTAGFQEVDDGYFETVGSATSAGTALSFTNVSGALGFDTAYISNTNGNGLFSNSTFALRISDGSVNVTNGAALTITNTALNLTFDEAGTDVRAANSTAANAISIGAGTSGTVNLGDVLTTGTGVGSDNLSIENSGAVVAASTLNLSGGRRGVSAVQNTGSFTVSGTSTIQNVTDTGIVSGNSIVTFNGNVTITGGAYGLRLDGTGNKTFGTVDVNGASTIGVLFGASAGSADTGNVTVGTLSVDMTGGGTIAGISAVAYEGIASFGATTIGTSGTAGSGGSSGVFLSEPGNTGGSITFASLAIAEAGIGVRSNNNNMSLTVSGATTLSNITTTGVDILTSSGNFSFQNITLTGPVATGMRFGTNTGTFSATGTTSLTGITSTGINANAATGTYNFGTLTIGYSGAGRGIDFRDSNVRFETNNFSLIGNGTAGSIGIDLSGSLNPNGANSATANILLAKDAGETAAISGVATGVRLGDVADGSAGANFVYGNQTPVNSGSSIAVISGGTTLDTSNLVSTNPTTQGRYEFRGVLFTGLATFEGTNPNYIFVGTNAAGVANGSNPNNRISTATFLASYNTAAILANKTVVFVNDNVAGINLGANTLNLGANTVLTGFGNGASIVVAGGVQPVNVIGDTFAPSGGTFSDPAGAATVLSNAGVSTLTLSTGNTLANFIVGNGGTSIFGTSFGMLNIDGLVVNNAIGGAMNLTTGTLVGAGFSSVTSGGGVNAISLTGVTGALNFGTGSLSGASGATFSVNGGTIALTYSGNIAQGNNAALVSVSGGHSTGTLQFQTGTLSATNGTGLQFDNADGTYNFNGTTTLNGGDAGIDILNGSSGTLSFGTGASITSPFGTAFNVQNSSANITYNGTITQNNSAQAVSAIGNTGNTITFGGLIVASTGTSNAISLGSNTTFNFNGGLNLTTTTGNAFTTTSSGTVTVAATAGAETITTSGGRAIALGSTIGAGGVTFDSITATGPSSITAISLSSTGNTGMFTVTGTTAISDRGATAIDITGSGNATFGVVNITGRTGAAMGIDMSNSTGTLVFGNTTITNAGSSTGTDILYLNSTGSATFAQTNLDHNGATGHGIHVFGSNGSFTSNGGTVQGSAGFEVYVSGGTGIVNIASAITNTSGGSINVSSRGVGAGNVTFSGNINDTGAGMGVTSVTGGIVTFSGGSKVFSTGSNTAVTLFSNTGSTINFTGGGLVITTSTGTGFSATGGGTITVQGTGNTITTTGGGVGFSMAGTTIGAAGITFDSITGTGTSANALVSLNNVGNTGAFTVTGTTSTNGQAGISISNSGNANFGTVNILGRTGAAIGIDIDAATGTLVFGNATVNNTASATGVGIRFNNSSGSATFAQTNVDQNGTSGIGITITGASTGAFTSNGGTIQGSSAEEVNVTQGTGAVSIASAITNTSGSSILISTRTAGSITFSGNINDTGAGMGVSSVSGGTVTFSGASKVFNTTTNTAIALASNSGGTISFTNGGLAITTSSGTGFNATNGGTINVTGTGNSITTATGRILNWNNVNIGASGVTFASLQASGVVATTTILLDNVDGVGNTFSGGNVTIAGTSGVTSDGIRISGDSAADFTFASAAISNTGDDAIDITGLNGNVTFTTVNLNGMTGAGIELTPTAGSGSITVSGGTIGNTDDPAGIGIDINGGNGTITIAASVTKTTAGDIVEITGRTGGTVTLTGNLSATGAVANGIDINANTGGTIILSGAAKTLTTGANSAVSLVNNTGAAIDFTGGGLAITTTSGTAFSATGGGTVTVQGSGNTITTGTGTAVDINATTIGAAGITWASINTGTTANGILLDTVGNGFFTVNGGSITGTTRGVDINGGGGNVTIAASVATSGTSARSIEITAHTAGTVAFSGNITDGGVGMSLANNTGGTYNFSGASKSFTTGANAAVNLASNAGATINFTSGGLAITTTSGAGFTATGGGTVTVQGSNNTIASGSGTALNVANTTIGASGLTFLSISANGGARGIVLNNTGAGGLTVTGVGTTDGSGGTMQNISGRGIELLNASNISLSNMALTNASTTDGASGDDINTTGFNAAVYLSSVSTITLNNVDISGTNQQGINGNTVSNFTLNNSTITGVGDEIEEGAIKMRGLTGTATISNSDLSFSAAETVEIVNASGNLTLNVNNSTFRDTQSSGSGGTGIQLRSTGTATSIVNVTNSNFLRIRTVGLNVQALDTATADVDVSTSTFDPGTGTMIGIDLAADNAATLVFNIQNNTKIYSRNGPAVNIFGDNTATLNGRINNNPDIRVLTNVGSNVGTGVRVNLNKNSVGFLEIKSNVINVGSDDAGIEVSSIGKVNTNPGGTLDVIITGNNVTIGSTSTYGIFLLSASNAGDRNFMKANVANNTITRHPSTIASFRARVPSVNGTLQLQGFVTDPEATWNANGNTPTSSGGSEVSFGGSGTFGAGTPTAPSNPLLDADPLLFAPGGGISGSGSILSETSLSLLSSAAVNRWIASGVSADQLVLLQSVTFLLSDVLPAGYLGAADGTQIYISVDAAGNNWFVDETPWDDVEYTGTGLILTAASGSEAAGSVDALTVIMHELGHVIGFDDAYGSGIGGPLMEGYLGTGQRLMPAPGSALSIPTGGTPPALQPLLYQAPAPSASFPLLNQVPASSGSRPSAFHVPAQRKVKSSNVTPVVPVEGAAMNPFEITPIWLAPYLIPSLVQPAPVFDATQTQGEAPVKKVRAVKKSSVSASR